MIELAHVVDKTHLDLRKLKAPHEDIDRRLALRAIAENGRGLGALAGQIWHKLVAIPFIEGNIGNIEQPLSGKNLVWPAPELNRMNRAIGQIFAEKIGRLAACPARLNHPLDPELAAGEHDQRHL